MEAIASKVVRNVLLWLLLAALCTAPLGVAAEEPGEKAFLEWVGETAIQLDSAGDGSWATSADLSFLDEALRGKRIVYLGVSDHWISEKYDYRWLMIKYLVENGWRYIGMEMDVCDGRRMDRYLATGDSTYLKQVALYGYKGGWRGDRDDSPQGFPAIDDPNFGRGFLKQGYRFLGELRSLSETRLPGPERLHWFGFDLGLFPSVAYEDAESILSARRSDPLVQEIARRMQRVEGETRVEEAQRLDDLVGFIESDPGKVIAILGEVQTKRLVRTLRHQAENVLFREAAKDGPSTMDWIQGLMRRERHDMSVLDEIFEELPPGEKVILMGHNLHLNKDSDNIGFGPIGASALNMWTSVGTHLARKFPGEVYAIWMMYDHGRHNVLTSPAALEEVQTNPSTVEHVLAKAGAVFYLPLNTGDEREGFLHERQQFLQNGAMANGVVADQADALFFVREATALAQW
jgi:erythromycin esterase-like protein